MKIETILAAKGPKTVTIAATASVREAVQALSSHNVGALIVVDAAGYPDGILSERDVIRCLAERDDVLAPTVGDLMTSPVTVGTPQDDVESVLRTMTARHFRHLPVVEGRKLVGMVTLGDLVKGQLAEYRGAVATLETQLMES